MTEQPPTTRTKLTPEQQKAVSYWPLEAKIPIIPCDSKNKTFGLAKWRDVDFSKIDFTANLAAGVYDNGIAIVLGKTLPGCPYPYSFALDFDGEDAVKGFFGSWDNVLKLADTHRIEWHGDNGRLHIVFFSENNVTKKRIIIKKHAFEVRFDDLLICSPSIHGDRNAWTVLGPQEEIPFKSNEQMAALEAKIDNLSRGFMPESDREAYISRLESSIIHEGQGRHDAIKNIGCSYYFKHKGEWLEFGDDQRREKLEEWNNQHCIPPLPQKEFDELWKWIVNTHRTTRDQEHEKYREAKSESGNTDAVLLDKNIKNDLEGSIYYTTKLKPLTVIVAYNRTKMLIESYEKKIEVDRFDPNSKETTSEEIKVLSQKKLYLTCIPISMTRHKNPLSFLEAVPKYTITFVDSVGNTFTFKYKTLSEIISGLRDNGYVQSDGAEGALGVMILAFTKNMLLQENYDMEYTGFFFDEDNDKKRIFESNIHICKQVDIEGLRTALKTIEDAATKYYSNPDRLDLIATAMVWGMAAPISFMFKSNVYYLRWLHLWGFSNATKSNTGMLVLAIDGHHKDSKFIRNISNIDTIARLGDELSKTTFPKMFDEVDLSDERYKHIINQIKSAVSSKIIRSKFRQNGGTAFDIPALTPAILTSNPPPPLFDSAYMKRIIDRYFDKSETRKESDPIAVEFRRFLTTELDKIFRLGEFRNWYIINHQDLILSAVNEDKAEMLDVGFRILQAAYQYAGLEIPDWFSRRLSQTQLENSLVDNEVAIKNAFETLINVNLKAFNKYDIFEDSAIKDAVSNRVVNLLNGNKLSYMKRSRKDQNKIIINTGIINELYKYGVTKSQLPNLKALADHMQATYTHDEKGNVITLTTSQMERYFDGVEGDE